MKFRVIDAHLHLDESVDGPAENAVRVLCEGMDEAGVERGVLLHLGLQRWSAEEVSRAVVPHSDRIKSFINVHPFDEDAAAQLARGVGTLGYSGLKLHPRMQRYGLDDPRTGELVARAEELGVPVLIDAFPDGSWLLNGFDPCAFGRLARAHPNARIIAAHMGGQRVLDLMMIAKAVPNLYLDCSFSLLYYRGSSVPRDIVYAIKSMRHERVFYGSDYPDRSISLTLTESIKVFEEHGMSGEEIKSVLFGNAEEFFR